LILIDTSVWIDYLRGKDTSAVTQLEQILDRDLPYGITSLIYQEILQGADSELSLARFERYFGTQTLYLPRDPLATHGDAARLYGRCRRSGVTIRSTIDCLIAQIAIEQDLLLLHSDKDFDRIAAVVPELKIYS
jgi:predicted nucleic acid-binding protein